MANQTFPYKPNTVFYCPKCKADTPHYLRANAQTVVCLAHSRGEDRPVKHLVQALSINRGGPEKHI